VPVLGEIAKKARERMPLTWTALAKSGSSLGEEGLQGRVDAAKQELFGEVVAPEDELAAYGPMGTDYAGIVVCLKLTAAAYDHWMSQAVQMGATGKNETKTFVDRANAMLKFRDEILIPEERRLYPIVKGLLVDLLTTVREGALTVANPTDIGHVTPDPLTFEPAFERPRGVA
jgi:hypothetical protein